MNAPIFHRSLEQGSPEWFSKHIGIPTAGSFHRFMTTDFEVRKGEMFRSFVAEKVAESFRKSSAASPSSFHMENGLLLEEEAIPWFELEFDCELSRVGFIESADRRCGCSPDAMRSDLHGLEIKSPMAKTHVGYLLAGVVPADYVQQVHGSIYVSGADQWSFVSYHRGLPKLILTIRRDEAIMKKIHQSLNAFYLAFDSALARIKEMK